MKSVILTFIVALMSLAWLTGCNDEIAALAPEDNSTTYIHLNWGWNGNSNGYFEAGVFNTDMGTDLASSRGYDYSSDLWYFTIK